MCFSATASFTGAAVIGGLGVVTLPLVRERRELVFAALPLGFAAHQLVEGIVWTQLGGAEGAVTSGAAVRLWLLYAWVLLPVWIPLGVLLAEPPGGARWRRRVLVGAGVLGVGTAGLLFVLSQTQPVDVTVVGHHLEYRAPWSPAWLPLVPYVLVTCGAPLASSQRFIRLFGATNLVALAVTVEVASQQLSSVWCFFAALISAEILAHYLLRWRAESAVDRLHPAT